MHNNTAQYLGISITGTFRVYTGIAIPAQIMPLGHSPLAAVAAYDYLLSLPEEIRLAWKKPLTPARIIYFAGRYSIFLWSITDIPNAQNLVSFPSHPILPMG